MELTADIFNFIADALSRLPEVRWGECSGSRKVVTTLLIRLGNDLRCASMLAIRGYPAQAAAVVATMYEVAYTVAFIGADESHAAACVSACAALAGSAISGLTFLVTLRSPRSIGLAVT